MFTFTPIASKMVVLTGLGLLLAACGTTPTPPPDHPPVVVTTPKRQPPPVAPKDLVPAELRCKADDDCSMSSFAGCLLVLSLQDRAHSDQQARADRAAQPLRGRGLRALPKEVRAL